MRGEPVFFSMCVRYKPLPVTTKSLRHKPSPVTADVNETFDMIMLCSISSLYEARALDLFHLPLDRTFCVLPPLTCRAFSKYPSTGPAR